jgi:hypothetical protein
VLVRKGEVGLDAYADAGELIRDDNDLDGANALLIEPGGDRNGDLDLEVNVFLGFLIGDNLSKTFSNLLICVIVGCLLLTDDAVCNGWYVVVLIMLSSIFCNKLSMHDFDVNVEV